MFNITLFLHGNNHCSHVDDLGLSFTILIPGLQLQVGTAPLWRKAAADVWCFSVEPHFLFHNCLIDVIYQGGGKTLLPSDVHTQHTCVKRIHHQGGFPPSVHYSQLWHFPSAVLHFLDFAEKILAIHSSILPSFHPSRGCHKVTASIKHCICLQLSKNKENHSKSHLYFFTYCKSVCAF